ncbi:hypothetical protein Hrd1104_05905 [Halorhabdus sp. CBA1104]|uniref:DUF7331 family protein n=1 Tax=unclassified Halorhabdus TaxID=2621901 RepID=UPI0012B3C344|nr:MULTISPECIES: hypothetical protein [unclassified Halorhabdus]QGN06873.1 hypothetical protein Hrd1104_05905 [Halorhabdus sp. CBA1104]
MSNPADGSRSDGVPSGEHQLPEPSETAPIVEFYETDDETVLYDADNPLAWVCSDDAIELSAYR